MHSLLRWADMGGGGSMVHARVPVEAASFVSVAERREAGGRAA